MLYLAFTPHGKSAYRMLFAAPSPSSPDAHFLDQRAPLRREARRKIMAGTFILYAAWGKPRPPLPRLPPQLAFLLFTVVAVVCFVAMFVYPQIHHVFLLFTSHTFAL